jgi:hypothetical protein
MRYQQIGGLNEDRLGEFAAGFRSLRMNRVLKTFFDWRKEAGTEEIE